MEEEEQGREKLGRIARRETTYRDPFWIDRGFDNDTSRHHESVKSGRPAITIDVQGDYPRQLSHSHHTSPSRYSFSVNFSHPFVPSAMAHRPSRCPAIL